MTLYFAPDVTRRVIAGFHRLHAPGGWLLLGHAETLWRHQQPFRLVQLGDAFAYQKHAAAPDRQRPSAPTGRPAAGRPAAGRPAAGRPAAGRPAPPRAVPPPPTATPTSPPTGDAAGGRCHATAGQSTGGGPGHRRAADEPGRRHGESGGGGAGDEPGRRRGGPGGGQGDAAGWPLRRCRAARRGLLAGAPLHAEAYLLRALALEAQGRRDAAVADLRRALYADPTLAPAELALAVATCHLGDPAAARRHYRNAAAAFRAGGEARWAPYLDGRPLGELIALCDAEGADPS